MGFSLNLQQEYIYGNARRKLNNEVTHFCHIYTTHILHSAIYNYLPQVRVNFIIYTIIWSGNWSTRKLGHSPNCVKYLLRNWNFKKLILHKVEDIEGYFVQVELNKLCQCRKKQKYIWSSVISLEYFYTWIQDYQDWDFFQTSVHSNPYTK